jgi:hypothetical protein
VEKLEEDYRLSAKPSELMLDLLKELALLKQLDEKHQGQPKSDTGNAEFEGRQTRRQEICDQIKALAEPTA